MYSHVVAALQLLLFETQYELVLVTHLPILFSLLLFSLFCCLLLAIKLFVAISEDILGTYAASSQNDHEALLQSSKAVWRYKLSVLTTIQTVFQQLLSKWSSTRALKDRLTTRCKKEMIEARIICRQFNTNVIRYNKSRLRRWWDRNMLSWLRSAYSAGAWVIQPQRWAQLRNIDLTLLRAVITCYCACWSFAATFWIELFSVIHRYIDWLWKVRAPLLQMQTAEIVDTRLNRVQMLIDHVFKLTAENEKLREENWILHQERPPSFDIWERTVERKQWCDMVGLSYDDRGWVLFAKAMIWKRPLPHFRKAWVQYMLVALLLSLGLIKLVCFLGPLRSVAALFLVCWSGRLELPNGRGWELTDQLFGWKLSL